MERKKKMNYKYIDNKYPIEIKRKEIYPGIFEYSLPGDYYFESSGTNYGNRIYARAITDNFYIVRKIYEDNTSKDSE